MFVNGDMTSVNVLCRVDALAVAASDINVKPVSQWLRSVCLHSSVTAEFVDDSFSSITDRVYMNACVRASVCVCVCVFDL